MPPHLANFIHSLVPGADSVPAYFTSFVPGKTPLSTWPEVVCMTVTYLVVVFGTREAMKDKEPLKLNALFRLHNMVLSVGSFILMILIGEEVLSNWSKPGIGTYGVMCAKEAYTERLEFYMMLTYYFKYYEFLDTVFLALKKKPLTFLHVYHHSATAILVFVYVNVRPTAGWSATCVNLGIHVLMYYYYYAAAGGAKLWWKRYLTTIQIAQFVIVLVVGTFLYHQHTAYSRFPKYLLLKGECNIGQITTVAVVLGYVVFTSILFLFLDFFRKTYRRNLHSEKSKQ